MTTETLQQKTALIVGASRGLGMALAAEYLRCGWHVIATIRQATGSAEFQALQAAAGAALEVPQIEMISSAQLDIETSIPGVVDVIAQRSGAGGVTYVNYQNQILPW